MTIDELIADIERRIACVEGLPMARCQTGEIYVIFRSCGLEVRQGFGGEHLRLFDTEAEAINKLHDHIAAHIQGAAGTLYWRAPASVEHVKPLRADFRRGLPGHAGGYSARARFVVSGKPILWATLEDHDKATA